MTRKPAIKPEDIQVTYSRRSNIKDMIIKTEIYKQHRPKMCQPCHKPRCKTCLQRETTQTVTNKPTTAIQSEEFQLPITKYNLCAKMYDLWNAICWRKLKHYEHKMQRTCKHNKKPQKITQWPYILDHITTPLKTSSSQ